MKTIKVGDKTIGLKASPLAFLYYQQSFKRDLMEDIVGLQDLEKLSSGDFAGFDTVKILQMGYVMNKADNFGKSFPNFDEWVAGLEDIDIMDFMVEVAEEAADGFFRSGANKQGKGGK